jgi:hypothetical protein
MKHGGACPGRTCSVGLDNRKMKTGRAAAHNPNEERGNRKGVVFQSTTKVTFGSLQNETIYRIAALVSTGTKSKNYSADGRNWSEREVVVAVAVTGWMDYSVMKRGIGSDVTKLPPNHQWVLGGGVCSFWLRQSYPFSVNRSMPTMQCLQYICLQLSPLLFLRTSRGGGGGGPSHTNKMGSPPVQGPGRAPRGRGTRPVISPEQRHSFVFGNASNAQQPVPDSQKNQNQNCAPRAFWTIAPAWWKREQMLWAGGTFRQTSCIERKAARRTTSCAFPQKDHRRPAHGNAAAAAAADHTHTLPVPRPCPIHTDRALRAPPDVEEECVCVCLCVSVCVCVCACVRVCEGAPE